MPYILYSLLALTAIIISEHNSFRNNAYAETHKDSIIKIAQKYEKAHAFNGVLLVAEDGNVKYEGAFGVADRNWSIPHETNSKFMIASITKSHTAILVMQLVEEGLIALDDVISDHLSEFPAPYKDTITIHHLLSHRSGIPHYTQIPGWFTGEFLGEINDNEFLKTIGALPLPSALGDLGGKAALRAKLMRLVPTQNGLACGGDFGVKRRQKRHNAADFGKRTALRCVGHGLGRMIHKFSNRSQVNIRRGPLRQISGENRRIIRG